jgi:hypothetical protein
MTAAADRNLLFGLLALQNCLIDQRQLIIAFQAWTRDKARSLAEHLAARGDLDADQRTGVETMVALHLKKHGGDVERSLAVIGDPAIEQTLTRLTAAAFTGRLVGAGVAVSMDGRGRALHNVFVERLWRSVKYEDIYIRRYETVPELHRGLARNFGFYNGERLHQSLGYRTSAGVYRGAGITGP